MSYDVKPATIEAMIRRRHPNWSADRVAAELAAHFGPRLPAPISSRALMIRRDR